MTRMVVSARNYVKLLSYCGCRRLGNNHRWCTMSYCGCRRLGNNHRPQASYSTDPGHDKGQHLKPPGSVFTFLIKKYVGYIERFELKVESHYPKFYKVYKLFKDGIVDFFNDTKIYSVVATRIWAGEDLEVFTWKELEIYRQMPSHLVKSAPVLIAAPLPAVPYFFYPVCYMFPRHLLCPYFWTPTQKLDFGLHYLRHRLPFYAKVLHFLERHSVDIRDTGKKRIFQDILLKIEQGSQPEAGELLEVKDLFEGRPFGLRRANKLHMWHVARSLDFSTMSKKRFMNAAILLHNIDMAVCREGVESLSVDALRESCFTRGLNPTGLEDKEMQEFMKEWTHLSRNIEESSLSLLVHAPVLLTYNRPTNKRYLLRNVDDTS